MAAVIDRIKHEPAVVIATVAAALDALQNAVGDDTALTWRTVATVALGLIIRQFVTPVAK